MILLSRKGARHAPGRFIGSLYTLAISALLAGSHSFAQKPLTRSTRLRSRRYPEAP